MTLFLFELRVGELRGFEFVPLLYAAQTRRKHDKILLGQSRACVGVCTAMGFMRGDSGNQTAAYLTSSLAPVAT